MSARIPGSEHSNILGEFEKHAANGFGRPVSIEGYALSESSFESALGRILLVTSRELAETYAYYDWEEPS